MDRDLDGIEELVGLTTEGHDPRFSAIDTLSVIDLVTLMNDTDFAVPRAIRDVLPWIAVAIEAVVERMSRGGRLVYVGAGSSGRIGILDASESPPTFGTEPDVVRAIIAGGNDAFATPQEGIEDSREAGEAAIDDAGLTELDTVVGIASSGRTPFVLGAIACARRRGALTIGLSCNEATPLSSEVDHSIEVIVGPELISGSTRLKAGSAQKMVLNMISTITMVRLGKTYGNYMVDVRVSNTKLRERAISIVSELTPLSREEAARLLADSGYAVKQAVLIARTGISASEATERLSRVGGNLRAALEGSE